jgi:3-hydroxyisobutyrate dehydrogenase-like beta-hydroxyacid dehydrogenase
MQLPSLEAGVLTQPASIIDARSGLMVDSLKNQANPGFLERDIGVVGLGHMGHAFAMNFIEAGYKVLAYDRDHKRGAELLAARAVQGLSDLAACAAVVTSLPDDDAFAAVTLGAEGLTVVLGAGAVHISMSTISPTISRRVALEHARQQQDYVAVPIGTNP